LWRENEAGVLNAYYTLPAIVNLAGDAADRRILDAAAVPALCPRHCASGTRS
jgi:hypothetical protein